jgi:hypothetical protein
MIFKTENGSRIIDPTPAQIDAGVRALDPDKNSFAIVSQGEQRYLQVALNPDGVFLLEYRGGSADSHFTASSPIMDVDCVASAFTAYLSGGDFRAGLSWAPTRF